MAATMKALPPPESSRGHDPTEPAHAPQDRLVRVPDTGVVRTTAHHERSLVGFELLCESATLDGSERLGEILELVHIGHERYFLIDSRHWTYGSRRLIPTWAVTSIDLVDRACRTNLPVPVIRRSPDFDPFRLADTRYHQVLHNVFEQSE